MKSVEYQRNCERMKKGVDVSLFEQDGGGEREFMEGRKFPRT
jgi:hypothetical protein